MNADIEGDEIEIRPLTRPPDATVALPGSKSLTNRALLLAALADGRSTLTRALASDDTRYMAEALRALGVTVRADEGGERLEVEGRGGAVPAPGAELYVGNSGTSIRFVCAYVALGRGRFRLDGTARMRERPIGPLLDALRGLGVDARSEQGAGYPPVIVEADGPPRGGGARLDGSLSSQYLSALLMVGPCLRDGLEVEIAGELVSRPYVELTLGLMAEWGVEVDAADAPRVYRVAGGQRYAARRYAVEPDASAASYFFAAAAVTRGRVRVPGLGSAARQGDLDFVRVLERMGCAVEVGEDWTTVRGPERLRGVSVDMGEIPDTAQTLAAIAPWADAPVAITGIAHNRGKETDRIGAVVRELRRLGVRAEEMPDGMVVHPGAVRPATVETYDDHRMAMSFAVAGLVAPGIRIRDPACVSKTFPRFWETLETLR